MTSDIEDLSAGRRAHERLLVEILTKGRSAGPAAESIRVLSRTVTDVIRKFLDRRGADVVNFREDAWATVLVNLAHRCQSQQDVDRIAREIAHEKFPAFCNALLDRYRHEMPGSGGDGSMIEHFVYRELARQEQRKRTPKGWPR